MSEKMTVLNIRLGLDEKGKIKNKAEKRGPFFKFLCTKCIAFRS